MPTRLNSSGFVNGSSIVSRISRTCSFKPPISPNDMLESPSSFM